MSMFNISYRCYRYSMCFEHNGRLRTKTFASREAANQEMYRLMGKHKLQLVTVYNDNHYRTYVCDGAKFYINRY